MSAQTDVRDIGPAWTTSLGVTGKQFTSADASGADAAVTDFAAASKNIYVTDLILAVGATAMRLDFKDGTGGNVLFAVSLPVNGSIIISPRGDLKVPTAANNLFVRASAAGNLYVTALGYAK